MPEDFQKRIATIFMYQMEKKRKGNFMWEIASFILRKINSVSANLKYDRTEDLWYTIKKTEYLYQFLIIGKTRTECWL